MANFPLHRVSLGEVRVRMFVSDSSVLPLQLPLRTTQTLESLVQKKNQAQWLDLNQHERLRMELPGYSLQSQRYEQKGQQGEVGAADH